MKTLIKKIPSAVAFVVVFVVVGMTADYSLSNSAEEKAYIAKMSQNK